tara:strand:- start:534 stop:2852 length:2319 start_codon:yes stop_codon:yes gene_type:complete
MENQVQKQETKYTVLDYKIVPSFSNTILNYLLKLLFLIKDILTPYSLIFLILSNLNSQQKKIEYHVKFSTNNIKIDGVVDEDSWKRANKMYANWQHFPNETKEFNNPTELRILFDDENIYLLCKSFSKTNDYVIPSLKWDFSGAASDKVNFLFDTFSDGNNAYMFGSNMLGVKSDILVSNGGVGSSRTDTNRSWNGNFDVEGKIYDDYYIIEMKIPLSTFNYPENSKSWRFNFFRFDTEENQRTTWVRIPQEFNDYNLAFMGKIIFESPLKQSKGKTWLIPFTNGFIEKDFSENKLENNLKYGLDIRIPLKSELNLDVTFNSDFSQVEIDDEIVNFTRFEFKMPEKRQFFLENNDIYTNFGEDLMMNPFFSRRIGLARNNQGDLIENKILSGIRVSGKINNNLKLGFLNMITDEDLNNNIPMNLNSVISLHQRVFKRSLVKFLFVNRQNTNDYEFVNYEDKFNRVVGIEYDLITEKNKWNGRGYFYKSFENIKKDDNASGGFTINRTTRNHKLRINYHYLGDDFRSDLGFMRRKGVSKLKPHYIYTIYPNTSNLNSISFRYQYVFYYKHNDEIENIHYNTSWLFSTFTFKNQSEFSLKYQNRIEYIPYNFDPTGVDTLNEIKGEKNYHSEFFEAQYSSDPSRDFIYELSCETGKFFGGRIVSLRNDLYFRIQPKLVSSLKLYYDKIKLGSNFPTTNIFLTSSKFDFTFTKTLYWATIFQYSSQSENFGINSRFQWRFKGLSNLYLIYNDNYLVQNELIPRRRGINLKLVHWF